MICNCYLCLLAASSYMYMYRSVILHLVPVVGNQWLDTSTCLCVLLDQACPNDALHHTSNHIHLCTCMRIHDLRHSIITCNTKSIEVASYLLYFTRSLLSPWSRRGSMYQLKSKDGGQVDNLWQHYVENKFTQHKHAIAGVSQVQSWGCSGLRKH